MLLSIGCGLVQNETKRRRVWRCTNVSRPETLSRTDVQNLEVNMSRSISEELTMK